MAIEARRGCGYRKIGGTYMVSGGAAGPCCKIPILLDIQARGAVNQMHLTTKYGIQQVATTQGGFKLSRGWQWVDPQQYLTDIACTADNSGYGVCPCDSTSMLGNKVGMIWIGEQFYPTPSAFNKEAAEMGISRRINTIPLGFELGKHWVFLCHSRIKDVFDPTTGNTLWLGGIFRLFKPERIEKLITQTQSQDNEEMAELARKKITPVIVPDNDPDHQGSVFDKEQKQEELDLADA